MTTPHQPQVPISFDALSVGRSSTTSFITQFSTRDPNSNDVNFPIQQRWYNTLLENEWILTSFAVSNNVKTAIWQPISQFTVTTETLTGNSGGAVGVDGSNNINVVGDVSTVNVVGNPGTHTLTISAGASVGQTITGNSGGALSPTAGNWNILGASTAAGTSPVTTAGAVSTLTINVQKAQALAATDATKIGLSNFDSARFTVDANGFVSTSGTGVLNTLTGNSGGAISPTAGNINTVGTGSITIAGAGSTLTTQLTGLTNHAVLVGAGTATITNVGVGATGTVLIGNTGADPSFSATPNVTSITFGAGIPLSVYNKGTWTPTLAFGGASVDITYSSQVGYWEQVGNIVFWWFAIVLTNKGSSTGIATIGGLPQTSQAGPGGTSVSLSQLAINTITLDAGHTQTNAAVTPSATSMSLSENGSGLGYVNLQDTNFANTSACASSGFYFITN